MKYVNKTMVIVINHLVIKLSGGSFTPLNNNIRQGMTLGFVERIYTNNMFGEKLYPDIFHQAAAYMFYIIKNHVFFDGNKRTGLAVAVTFLRWNNIMFLPFHEDAVFDYVVGIAAGDNEPDYVISSAAEWFQTMSIY